MKKLSRRHYIRLIALFSFLALIFCVSTLVSAGRVKKLNRIIDIYNQQALNELCESVDSITVDLQKCLYSGSADMLREQGNILCREATVAKENLSMLTNEDTGTREIFRFLSQVGNYTVALSENKASLTSSDRENLAALYEYSKALGNALTDILIGYGDGTVSFESPTSTLSLDSVELPEDFYSKMNDTEQTITDYPTLLYDGPFSDSQNNKKSVFTESLSEITKDEAKTIAAKLIEASPSSLREEKDVTGGLELFCFSLEDNYISITKKGGYVCSLISNTLAGEATISATEAVERGKSFLAGLGYKNMTDSYYTVYDGICTVNYAYEESGVICYSDLIKVSIALDTGKAVELDASSFLTNHKSRTFPRSTLSAVDARKLLSTELTVLSYKKAMIPLDSGKESLCYEFHCRHSNSQEVLVYIDCQTGKEQEIMLLLYEDGGILTK